MLVQKDHGYSTLRDLLHGLMGHWRHFRFLVGISLCLNVFFVPKHYKISDFSKNMVSRTVIHSPLITQLRLPRFSFLRRLTLKSCLCVCVCRLFPAQASMGKASSLSECRLLSVRRSGRRRRSLGKRVVSSGRWRVMSDRRARIRLSCSCSTACMSEIPVRSVEQSNCEC